MQGIVTSADVAGLIQQEAGEDIVKIGGMEALDGPYLEVTFGQMVRKRAGWLAILFVGEMLTATAMGFFSGEIERAVVLALFIPLIISSGGNSGSQATTLVIRAMALGRFDCGTGGASFSVSSRPEWCWEPYSGLSESRGFFFGTRCEGHMGHTMGSWRSLSDAASSEW